MGQVVQKGVGAGDKYATGWLETNMPQVGWRQIYHRTAEDKYATGRLETNMPQDGWRQICHRTAGDGFLKVYGLLLRVQGGAT